MLSKYPSESPPSFRSLSAVTLCPLRGHRGSGQCHGGLQEGRCPWPTSVVTVSPDRPQPREVGPRVPDTADSSVGESAGPRVLSFSNKLQEEEEPVLLMNRRDGLSKHYMTLFGSSFK